MTKQMKQYEVLKRASLFLEKHGCEQHIGELLLQYHLQLSRSAFYAHMHQEISPSVIDRLFTDLKKHVEIGVPIQHLTGYEYFYGRKFSVNKHVLIPRPETEELVAYVINAVHENYPDEPITIVDIGTGSGVIAITLALHIQQATVYATDISKQALHVAQQNASVLGANVHFRHGNYVQPLIDEHRSVDVIVSNPPYIARKEAPTLSRTVKDFDPELALFAENEGIAAYRTIVEQSQQLPKRPEIIAFEIGYEQGNDVRSIINNMYPHSHTDVRQDINGKDRIVISQL